MRCSPYPLPQLPSPSLSRPESVTHNPHGTTSCLAPRLDLFANQAPNASRLAYGGVKPLSRLLDASSSAWMASRINDCASPLTSCVPSSARLARRPVRIHPNGCHGRGRLPRHVAAAARGDTKLHQPRFHGLEAHCGQCVVPRLRHLALSPAPLYRALHCTEDLQR